MTEIIVIFFLLLLNAFFAMSELAIVSASKPLLRQKAKQGNTRAAAALALAEDSGNFLSTVQVGITLVGILAGTYGGASITEKLGPVLNAYQVIAPYGHALAGAIVVALITYFSVIIGELIPKQLALRNAEAIAMIVALPMSILSKITAPVVYLFETSARVLMRLLGIRGADGEEVTEAEVHAVLAEGAESGVFEKSEHEMLRRIISLADRSVKSIMTHRTEMVAIDINDSWEEVIEAVQSAGHSRYPVIDGDNDTVVGAVRAKNILRASLSPKNFQMKNYVEEIPSVPEMTTCLKAFEIFKSSNIHMAVIVDEYGSTEGIVTSADLLEAVIGILPSNYDDVEDIAIRERDDGSWLIDGRTPIHEMQLTFGLDQLSTDDGYETIAGFLVQQLRKNPVEGDKFESFGYVFEVIDMDGRRIDKILMARARSVQSNSDAA
ncbi:HlyC/CorC family transporter [Rhizobium sp. TH2]|uniref:hemolysin family protein n=1 Tax=Rhizobium sp. TH2 TaxID=2775403 RepID=UPI0021585A26|nr:hemolysin family protein [Rhizobium sp. TH2]UVC11088.1 HlyC/CorC family transporter [Rhizobium sp. TH2]